MTMTKTIKIIAIATAITVIIMISCAYAVAASAEELPEDFYTMNAVVVGWMRIGDTDLRTIDCLAEDGNVWSFYDNEGDLDIGDTVTLVMWECTEAEEDDEIVDVIWTGYIEPVEMARYLRTFE